jgi:hypothetical protein
MIGKELLKKSIRMTKMKMERKDLKMMIMMMM